MINSANTQLSLNKALLQLLSEHILLAPLKGGVPPAPWQMWWYTPPTSRTICPQRLTCRAPLFLPQNHKTEQQFGSSTDSQPVLTLMKISLIGIENETHSLGLLFLWCLKDTESAALAKLRSASAGVHPKRSHNTHGLTHTQEPQTAKKQTTDLLNSLIHYRKKSLKTPHAHSV